MRAVAVLDPSDDALEAEVRHGEQLRIAQHLEQVVPGSQVSGLGEQDVIEGRRSLAIGTMIRHTAGAIVTIIGIVFVLPILTGLPGSWGAHINAYLPEQAGTLITHTQEQSGDLLSPWQGFGVLCIWTVLALAAAACLLERRDA